MVTKVHIEAITFIGFCRISGILERAISEGRKDGSGSGNQGSYYPGVSLAYYPPVRVNRDRYIRQSSSPGRQLGVR